MLLLRPKGAAGKAVAGVTTFLKFTPKIGRDVVAITLYGKGDWSG